MRLIECVQGTPEWHQARAGVITASMYSVAVGITSTLDEKQRTYVEAILGGCTEEDARAKAGYKAAPRAGAVADALAGKPTWHPSRESLAYSDEIAIERISEEPYGDTYQTYAMKRGSEEEFWARARYEQLYDVDVEECGVALTDDGLFGYSTDGFVGTKGMVEVKTPLNLSKVRAVLETDATDEYDHQIQGGLWLTGREWCDFIMYVPCLRKIENDIYVKRIYRDETFIEKLERDLWSFQLRTAEAEKFWRTQFRRDGLAAKLDRETVTDIAHRDVAPWEEMPSGIVVPTAVAPAAPRAMKSRLAGLLSA